MPFCICQSINTDISGTTGNNRSDSQCDIESRDIFFPAKENIHRLFQTLKLIFYHLLSLHRGHIFLKKGSWWKTFHNVKNRHYHLNVVHYLKTALRNHSQLATERFKMQQMQAREAVASYKRHKRGSDANPGASGNHYCLGAVPSAFPGTYQTQNGAQGLMIMS